LVQNIGDSCGIGGDYGGERIESRFIQLQQNKDFVKHNFEESDKNNENGSNFNDDSQPELVSDGTALFNTNNIQWGDDNVNRHHPQPQIRLPKLSVLFFEQKIKKNTQNFQLSKKLQTPPKITLIANLSLLRISLYDITQHISMGFGARIDDNFGAI